MSARAESKQRVLLWFSHFSMDGLGSFKYGARALARYALTHRDEVSIRASHCLHGFSSTGPFS